jgi:hypothetical protein
LSARVPVTITALSCRALAGDGVRVSCAETLPANASSIAAGSQAFAIGWGRLLMVDSPWPGILRRNKHRLDRYRHAVNGRIDGYIVMPNRKVGRA